MTPQNNQQHPRKKDPFTRGLEIICILAMAALVLDVLAGVFTRFILNDPLRWTDEAATALLIWVALLGSALAYFENVHLGLEIVLRSFPLRLQKILSFIIHTLILAFAAVVMVYGGFFLTKGRYDSGQVLPALGWPKFIVYIAIPLSGIFIVAYAIVHMINLVRDKSDQSSA